MMAIGLPPRLGRTAAQDEFPQTGAAHLFPHFALRTSLGMLQDRDNSKRVPHKVTEKHYAPDSQ
jgi:hypothetical protein